MYLFKRCKRRNRLGKSNTARWQRFIITRAFLFLFWQNNQFTIFISFTFNQISFLIVGEPFSVLFFLFVPTVNAHLSIFIKSFKFSYLSFSFINLIRKLNLSARKIIGS